MGRWDDTLARRREEYQERYDRLYAACYAAYMAGIGGSTTSESDVKFWEEAGESASRRAEMAARSEPGLQAARQYIRALEAAEAANKE